MSPRGSYWLCRFYGGDTLAGRRHKAQRSGGGGAWRAPGECQEAQALHHIQGKTQSPEANQT